MEYQKEIIYQFNCGYHKDSNPNSVEFDNTDELIGFVKDRFRKLRILA